MQELKVGSWVLLSTGFTFGVLERSYAALGDRLVSPMELTQLLTAAVCGVAAYLLFPGSAK